MVNPRFWLLGGSWVVIRVISILITHIRGLITLLITTHEPPSRALKLRGWVHVLSFKG